MRHTGRILWFNDDQGIGYARPDGGSADCFVHVSGIQGSGVKSLAPGDAVAFDIAQSARGPAAENLVRLPHSDGGAS